MRQWWKNTAPIPDTSCKMNCATIAGTEPKLNHLHCETSNLMHLQHRGVELEHRAPIWANFSSDCFEKVWFSCLESINVLFTNRNKHGKHIISFQLMNPEYPRYMHHHVALETSLGARECSSNLVSELHYHVPPIISVMKRAQLSRTPFIFL